MPASVPLILFAQHSEEGRLFEMKHGGRKKGLVYVEEGSFALCPAIGG